MACYPFDVVLFRGVRAVPGLPLLQPEWEVHSFLIRHLTRREYEEWSLRYRTPAELEDRLLQEVVLEHPAEFRGSPWDWDQLPAGLVQQVVDQILQLSGFGQTVDPGMLQRVQTYLGSEQAEYDLLILTAFPYRLEDLQEMDTEQYHRLAGLARRKLEWFATPAGPAAPTGPAGAPVTGQPQFQRGRSRGGVERQDQIENAFSFTSA